MKYLIVPIIITSIYVGSVYYFRDINREAANSWLAAISVAACRGPEAIDLGEYHKGTISVYCIEEGKTTQINIVVDPALIDWIKSTGIREDEYWAVEVK